MRGSAENRTIILSYILSLFNSFHKRWFSLSCLRVQVVLDYKFCFKRQQAFGGAFLASSEKNYLRTFKDILKSQTMSWHPIRSNNTKWLWYNGYFNKTLDYWLHCCRAIINGKQKYTWPKITTRNFTTGTYFRNRPSEFFVLKLGAHPLLIIFSLSHKVHLCVSTFISTHFPFTCPLQKNRCLIWVTSVVYYMLE